MNERPIEPFVLDERWLAQRLGKVEASQLAAAMAGLIRSGKVPAGARLPTVRVLASSLGLSTGAVATAWSQLRADGLVNTRRRGGTLVVDKETAADSDALWNGNWASVDLALGVADPALLPPLDDALAKGVRTPNLHVSYGEVMTETLLNAVRPTWPFEAEAWTTGGAGRETMSLAIEAAAPRGDLVAIEEPTSPRVLEVVQAIGLRTVPVACDEQGPHPDALVAALARKPAAFIYQPRAQVPLGHAVSAERTEELARVMRQHGAATWVVEDDNVGPVAAALIHSIGSYLPDRVILVRDYGPTYGVDLRTSVIGGARILVDRASKLRCYGFAMTSRILQDALAFQIQNPEAQLAVDHARRRYALRRNLLTDALKIRGFTVNNRDGMHVWIPVPDENAALVNLASYGVTVGAGARCFSGAPTGGHLRILTSRLPDNGAAIEQLADLVMNAVEGKVRQGLD